MHTLLHVRACNAAETLCHATAQPPGQQTRQLLTLLSGVRGCNPWPATTPLPLFELLTVPSKHLMALSSSKARMPLPPAPHYAVGLPSSWTIGGGAYAGLEALAHFGCRGCHWQMAADAGLGFLPNLTWLDISYNVLVAGANTLPSCWEQVPLVVLKVGV